MEKKSSWREKLKWLDPFTYVDEYVLPRVNPSGNEVINWVVYLVSAFVFAFLVYSIFGLLLDTSSPMVVVVSGSMEPTLFRGDIMILQGVDDSSINAPELSLNVPHMCVHGVRSNG